MTTTIRMMLLAIALSLAAPAVALAQAPEAGNQVAAPDKYDSPMREQCMAELRKDTGWRASLKQELRVEVHNEEAELIAKNKQHVFWAYGALWIIMVVFVVFTWRKHKTLKDEVARLQREVDQATAD